jgi:hypothetical protein
MIFKRSTPETDELTLTLGEKSYTFSTPSEFEFALAGRTCVPVTKIASLVDVPDTDLLNEAEAIKQAERRFSEALSGVLANIADINQFLKEIDLSLISQDNEWRAIISALMPVPASFEHYKKIALVKYMQYLVSRQEIIKVLHEHRQKQKESAASGGDGHSEAESKLKETAIFDVTTFTAPAEDATEYGRLPKGETLEISVEPDEPFTLLVAKHKCKILRRDRLLFVDDKGQETTLRTGKNIIGRDAGADVVMDANLRDVSRKHLIVESDGTSVVLLTDISSHGSWVHPKYLDNTGI